MALLASGDAWPFPDPVGELLQLCRVPPVAAALGDLFPTPQALSHADQALRGAREELQRLDGAREGQACSARSAARGASMAAEGMGVALGAFQERCGESAGNGRVEAWELQPVVQELAALAAEAVWVQRLKDHIQGALALDAALASAEEGATAALRIASSPAAYPRVPAALLSASTSLRAAAHAAEALALQNPSWSRLLSSQQVRLERIFASLRPPTVAALRRTAAAMGLGPPPEPADGSAKGGGGLAALAGKIPAAFQGLAQDVVLREEFECLLAASASAQLEQWALGEAWRRAASRGGKSAAPAPGGALGAGAGRAGQGEAGQGEAGQVRAGPGEALVALEVLAQGVAQEALRCAAQWGKQPELAFALALRMARASVDAVEEACQPALERHGLALLDAREEWLRALVQAFPAPFLRLRLLPPLLAALQGQQRGRASGSLEEAAAAALWLHAVDQALSFDRIVAALVSSDAAAARASGARHQGGTGLEAFPSSTARAMAWATAGVFAERSEWRDAWLRVELEDVIPRADALLADAEQWEVAPQDGAERALRDVDSLLEAAALPLPGLPLASAPAVRQGRDVGGGGTEPEPEFRPSAGAVAFLKLVRDAVARFGGIPVAEHRWQLGGALCEACFSRARASFESRCLEAQAVGGLAASEEDIAALCWRMSAMRYFQFELLEWRGDAFWRGAAEEEPQAEAGPPPLVGPGEEEGRGEGWETLDVDLSSAEGVGAPGGQGEGAAGAGTESAIGRGSSGGGYLGAEAEQLSRMLQDWMRRLVDAQVRGFVAGAAEYVNTRRRWEEPGAPEASRPPVSRALLGPLARVQGRLGLTHGVLDAELFGLFWRRLAALLDAFLMEQVVFGGARFSARGAVQFEADFQGLCSAFCMATARPAPFFRRSQEAAILLSLPGSEAKVLEAMVLEAMVRPVLVSADEAAQGVTRAERLQALASRGILSLAEKDVVLVVSVRLQEEHDLT